MARTDNLNNFLTDVANSIRTKKGTSAPITASDFDTEIANLSSSDVVISDCSYLFQQGARHDQLEGLLKLCKNVHNAKGMFYNNPLITSFNFNDLHTLNLTDISSMFYVCNKLTTIEGTLDTSNVTAMTGMFYRTPITKADLSSFNTSKITSLNQLFYNCSQLTEVNLSSFDTSSVKSMEYMFYNCSKLASLDISNFRGDSLQYISEMFYGTKLTEIDLSNLNAPVLVDMSRAFYGCNLLKDLNLSGINANVLTNISNTFNGCLELENLTFMTNLGKGFTYKSANYGNYSVNISSSTKLTHDSLMDVINKLYDLNLTYDVANGGTLYTQKLILGETNLAKLTAEEIAIATNKGWTVS